MHVLDNPVWHALQGPQRILGRATELAGRFDEDVSPFGAIAEGANPDLAWPVLAQLLGPKGTVELTGDRPGPPTGWTVTSRLEGVQMVAESMPGRQTELGSARGRTTESPPLESAPEPSAVKTITPSPIPLGASDVPEMMALVKVARPGPFEARTIEFGGYVGIRIDGDLVAMAGERLRPPGYTEISAVATHPDYRHRGLARQVVVSVADNIIRRGDTPILHALVSNRGAIRLYESLGFTPRRLMTFQCLQAPG
ncbi:MAG TPA: GNAT family N-acetyltransferase [Acidimicrobiales bacterium]|nr:GNAT family N-acetyltransferase [Acidimicrobiales bacterium]